METLDFRQDIITRLIKLNKKNKTVIPTDLENINWTNIKSEIRQNIDKLKPSTRISEITAYILLSITGIIAFMKVMDLSSWPDLNKGALLIFLTVTNAFTTLIQKLRIERLENQIFLLDILEKIDAEK